MVVAAHESPSTSQSGRDLKASCKFEVIQHNIRHAFKEEAFRMPAANTVNRILRLSGLNIQRWHDPLFDLQSLTGKNAIATRSEEHTSELQSLMRLSYAVYCLKNTKI